MYSIIKRENIEIKNEFPKLNTTFCKYVVNRILEIDGFVPTENVCFSDKSEYINLSLYGIKE